MNQNTSTKKLEKKASQLNSPKFERYERSLEKPKKQASLSPEKEQGANPLS
jgi:hypothetical protein